MQPARLDLPVIPGTTTRQPLLLMQPSYLYKPIAAIQRTAPLLITVPGHGLPSEWPVWFEDVVGWSELRSDKTRQPFRIARTVDADTIELNGLNGLNQKASGGVLVYQPPVDLTGCTGLLRITSKDGAVLDLTTENGGLLIQGPGQLLVVITPAQADVLALARSDYWLDLTMSDGSVMRWLQGDVVVGTGGAHGC
ncbi:hypothetical protein NA655_08630 [Pseudomonas kuykendallii]|uniref:Uncharacterized protein n=1 Tax=Pseudomonas kuykendallii TaxID=1007099 RepID=A0A1H3EIG9_9PSED|nr:hypothetical protein [Pseudomonas kuykendallii]MCQ4271085.1 hypothetical protein [Pseudomonas kuykendallii]SDX78501.1 hypothetical protein SAMN05216287_3737 [Pseudomonas kuykendallii]